MLLTFVPYLILACLFHQSAPRDLSAKCCEKHSEVLIHEGNSTLECTKKIDTRLAVWSDTYNVLENNSDDGECIDLHGRDFYHFKLNGSTIVSKHPVTSSSIVLFRKCCPLDHVYDNTTRSCVKNQKENFIEGQFVKIGLPHCQMVIDKFFKNESDASAKVKYLQAGSYCLDRGMQDDFVVRECQEGLKICQQKRCFKKCCPDGQSFVGGGICNDSYVHGLKLKSQGYSPYIEDSEDEYELIYGTASKKEICKSVSIMPTNKIQYTIKKGGELTFYNNGTKSFQEHPVDQFESYCLEHATKGSLSGYFMFWCMPPEKIEAKFAYTMLSKILSCILLIATIVVYFWLGETKSTFGKILINYCLAMIFLMITLIRAQTYFKSGLECKIKAYLLIFFDVSAFAWVNVMSLDIWMTFGSPRRTIGSDQKKKDLKKFVLYLLYGWVMPLAYSLLILMFDKTKILPELIQPYIGVFKCFIEDRNYARHVLLLIPQLILESISSVLAIKTITYCVRVKNEIGKMNDSARNNNSRFAADKERLGLIVKLAIIMGMIWIFEVTTAFFEKMKDYSGFTQILEIILDNIVCLQGVFIFVIFICKKKTYNSIKKKLGLGERRVSSSLSQTSYVNGHDPMNRHMNKTLTVLSMNEIKT